MQTSGPKTPRAERFPIAVVVERIDLDNRWASERWEVIEVIPTAEGERGEPVTMPAPEGRARWLWPGFEIELHPTESEGYFLNVSAPEPKVFVSLRFEGEQPEPALVTASYNEAGRWIDGGERIDGVPMPEAILARVRRWVAANYRPEPRRKVRRNDPFGDAGRGGDRS